MPSNDSAVKPEEATYLFKRVIQLPPAIGDWTELRLAEPYPLRQKKKQLSFWGRIPEEKLISLHESHYQWANEETAHFKKGLAVSLELHSVALLQMRYQDFFKKENPPAVFTAYHLKSLDAHCYLFLEKMTFDAFINRTLGSPVTGLRSSGDTKPTEMENTTLQTLFEKPTASLFKMWEVEGTTLQTSPFSPVSTILDSSIPSSETFTLIEVAFSLNERILGKISIGYPLAALKKLLEKKGEARISFSTKWLPPSLLSSVSIPVVATLGQTMIPTKDLFDLKVGDVIQLDEKIQEVCKIQMGGKVELPFLPGSLQDQMAAKIHLSPMEGKMAFPEVSSSPMIETKEENSTETFETDPFADEESETKEGEKKEEEEEGEEDDFLSFD